MTLSCRLGVLAMAVTVGAPAAWAQKAPATPVNRDAQIMADFTKRVGTYVTLHKKLEGTLPALPKQTNPTEVDTHERALAKLIQENRADAKQGDLFTPAMQGLVRKLLRPIFN